MPKHEYGREGAYVQNQAFIRMLVWVGPLLFIGLWLLSLAFLGMNWLVGLPLLLLAPSAPTLLKAWSRAADKAIDPYVKGYRGERDVADALRSALGEDCYLVHDIDLGHGNVDHVAVTPAGIFTIETKAWAGAVKTSGDRLFINGKDQERMLRQAFAEAMTVRDYLKKVSGGRDHHVTPLLVFTEAKVDSYGRCRGVFVMRLDRLQYFLSSERQALDLKQRSAIAAALGVRTAG